MQVLEERKGEVVVLRLEGRLDVASAGAVEAQVASLIEKGTKKVLFHLGKVDYLSSAGMRVLLSLTKKFKALSGSFAICSLTADCADLIKMAGFNQILHIAPTEDAALKEM